MKVRVVEESPPPGEINVERGYDDMSSVGGDLSVGNIKRKSQRKGKKPLRYQD